MNYQPFSPSFSREATPPSEANTKTGQFSLYAPSSNAARSDIQDNSRSFWSRRSHYRPRRPSTPDPELEVGRTSFLGSYEHNGSAVDMDRRQILKECQCVRLEDYDWDRSSTTSTTGYDAPLSFVGRAEEAARPQPAVAGGPSASGLGCDCVDRATLPTIEADVEGTGAGKTRGSSRACGRPWAKWVPWVLLVMIALVIFTICLVYRFAATGDVE